MFGLIKGYWNQYFEKLTFKILIIGIDNVGKSHFLNQIKKLAGQKYMQPTKIIPTIGLNLAKVEQKNHFALYWDLGGAKNLRGIWKKYYSDCHGIIFIMDTDYEKKIDEVSQTFKDIIKQSDTQDVPILIIINKIDTFTNPEIQKQQIQNNIEQLFNLEDLRKSRTVNIVFISALNGTNIQESQQILFNSIID